MGRFEIECQAISIRQRRLTILTIPFHTMTPNDYIWQLREGRDREGDKFGWLICIHGSGRILASIRMPVSADEYEHTVVFEFPLPPTAPEGLNDNFSYVDEHSAKAFVEAMLARYEPVIAPKPKRVVAKKKRQKCKTR